VKALDGNGSRRREYRGLVESKAIEPARSSPASSIRRPGSVTRSLLWLGLLELLPFLDWHLARRGVWVDEATIWRSLPLVLTGGVFAISIASYALG
jgi:hypothetical protein